MLVAFCALGAAGPMAAAECEGRETATKLLVHVTGVSGSRGEVAVTVYPDDPRRFLAPKGKLLRARVPARTPVTSACFWLPRAGVYAIAVYHDTNADHDFNRNLAGLPVEGFGFSNDPPTSIGLPPFRSVRFSVAGPESVIRVKLRYLR